MESFINTLVKQMCSLPILLLPVNQINNSYILLPNIFEILSQC